MSQLTSLNHGDSLQGFYNQAISYDTYVGAAYGITFALMIFALVRIVVRHRRAKHMLRLLERP